MECPYLGGVKTFRVCNASITLMQPGEADRMTYCKTGEFYRCPTMLSHLLRGGTAPARGPVRKASAV
ncbi:MAG: hypothetical protein BMS9Abin23_0627 [Thermodesulfobacteriota bacterium]|nr:MAG: hypothetical protein BMS9Abin23_0627 [Thermodesulfobacteriota bacterium]